MNKFSIVLLTAAMTLGSGAAMADAGSNGTANQAADAGAVAPGAKQNMAPNKVSNDQINNTGDATSSGSTMNHDGNMSADEVHKNSQCKEGKCPDVNKKVGQDADTKTDGTTN